jgi:hypothetical protein
MTDDNLGQAPSSETSFRLELTPAELKITHTALKALLDGFGHEEHDVKQIVQGVLAKLPPEEKIRAIRVNDKAE